MRPCHAATRSTTPSRYEAHIHGDKFMREGFIRVYQDVRGKYGSEGNYVVTMPVRGPLNPAATDHVTDTWDSHRMAGEKRCRSPMAASAMLGNSHDGFYPPQMALLDPHPALESGGAGGSAAGRGWMGDDWFHYGAFRQMMLGLRAHADRSARRRTDPRRARSTTSTKSSCAPARSAATRPAMVWINCRSWSACWNIPRTTYWQGHAVDKLIVARPSKVPTLWTQGLWDQEDM